MLSVSGPDWPKTRRADWPISVVLIGQNHGSHQSPLMELSNTIHTQCTRKRTLNAIIHTAIHNVHSHTSHSHNKFKQTRDRQQHIFLACIFLSVISSSSKYSSIFCLNSANASPASSASQFIVGYGILWAMISIYRLFTDIVYSVQNNQCSLIFTILYVCDPSAAIHDVNSCIKDEVYLLDERIDAKRRVFQIILSVF